ncbi:MAG: transglutaminase domain-containing protein [Deltaproteobacteria bacterium]|nr:MAG: transglutaminase domain-containing protein [Deltaproteobacteria bacterium]
MMEEYLNPTRVIDCESRPIREKAEELISGVEETPERAKKVFYFVRDRIRYNMFEDIFSLDSYIASEVLKKGEGYCVQKAVLLTALARASGIPTRLFFADIRNHLAPQYVQEAMGTNLFTYHGYVEFCINDRWVKATPAFDLETCQRNEIIPVEFNGTEDALFHRCDRNGKLHIEYVCQHGYFTDLPFDEIIEAFRRVYGKAKPQYWGQNRAQ